MLDGEEIDTVEVDGGSVEALKMAMEIKGDEDYHLTDYIIECTTGEEEIDDYIDKLIQIAHEKEILNDDYPPIVLERLKELALADEQFERVIKIEALLNKEKA